jgi:gamma-glutamyltranspeptidase/glutathione hydrolase
MLQAIGILKALGWADWKRPDFETTRARVEALRIAWTDRLQYLGDTTFGNVPIDRLLSAKYADECAERVRAALKSGKPVDGMSDRRPAGGTIHLCAADKTGMMVALTFTHGEAFGAQVTVDGLGLILGHGMSRFNPHPKHPNSPGPGKRPLHNMCPTMVLKEGTPVLAIGAVGGRRIPNTLFDVLAY